MDKHCPTKTVKLRPQIDKPFITNELKMLDKQRKREYRKHRKIARYCFLNDLFNVKYRRASKDYLEKMMLELEKPNPAKANKLIKRLEKLKTKATFLFQTIKTCQLNSRPTE